MTFTNPYAYDASRNQGSLLRELVNLTGRRDDPTLEWTLAADGTRLTGRGSYDAVWLIAGRFDGDAREHVDAGKTHIEIEYNSATVIEFIIN